MADAYTELNPGVGGDVMDETGVTYPSSPTTRKRPRVVITGEGIDDIVPAPTTPPVGTEPGLVIRPIHSPYPGTPVGDLGSVSLVTSDTETTITSYIVPVGSVFYFLGFLGQGDVHAVYRIYHASTAKMSGRTSVAVPTVQVSFSYAIFSAEAGETVSLKVTHSSPGILGNFEGTIMGYLL